MRAIFITLIGLFVLSFSVTANEQSLAQAEEAYRTGNYEASITFYEFSLLDEPDNGAIYANLAHAYYMDGQLGKAMLNYRRAQDLIPRHALIAEQIRQIEIERIDGVLPQTDGLLIVDKLTSNYLTLTELAIILFVLWTVFFIGISISRNRRLLTIIISGLGIIIVILCGLLMTRLYIETQHPPAIVITQEIAVMSGPSDEFLMLFTLHEGTELSVLERRDAWVRIGLSDGRQGWILDRSLAYVSRRLR